MLPLFDEDSVTPNLVRELLTDYISMAWGSIGIPWDAMSLPMRNKYIGPGPLSTFPDINPLNLSRSELFSLLKLIRESENRRVDPILFCLTKANLQDLQDENEITELPDPIFTPTSPAAPSPPSLTPPHVDSVNSPLASAPSSAPAPTLSSLAPAPAPSLAPAPAPLAPAPTPAMAPAPAPSSLAPAPLAPLPASSLVHAPTSALAPAPAPSSLAPTPAPAIAPAPTPSSLAPAPLAPAPTPALAPAPAPSSLAPMPAPALASAPAPSSLAPTPLAPAPTPSLVTETLTIRLPSSLARTAQSNAPSNPGPIKAAKRGRPSASKKGSAVGTSSVRKSARTIPAKRKDMGEIQPTASSAEVASTSTRKSKRPRWCWQDGEGNLLEPDGVTKIQVPAAVDSGV
ncbi:hypothetical protein BJ912DRAFT_1064073 [Pholiota molesta]|nr:hypothetical protein BJ912DRAFT_1064073 [Pholiota molesta]